VKARRPFYNDVVLNLLVDSNEPGAADRRRSAIFASCNSVSRNEGNLSRKMKTADLSDSDADQEIEGVFCLARISRSSRAALTHSFIKSRSGNCILSAVSEKDRRSS
jgi:hypothetical protein